MSNTSQSTFKQVRVLLIEGRARQIMPLMESMHELGCHVTTFNTSKLDMGYVSRYPDKKIIKKCNMNDPDEYWKAVKPVLMSGKFDIAIPMFDFSAEILAKHKKEMESYVTIAVNDLDIFSYARDKLKTMQICMEKSIPCPKTYITDESLNNINALNIRYPVCIKPRSGSSAVGFRVINNETELKEIVPATVKKYGKSLIQEYIPQTDLQYKAEFYIDNEGNVKSACVFAKVRWYPLNGGSSTLNVTVNRPDIIKSCVNLLRAINWRGYADIDLIQDPRDGLAKIMEINPRITGSVKICYAAGVNFSRQIVEDYLGLPVTSYLRYKKGKYLRYLHTDILWFIKSKDRFRCKPSWFDFRNSVDQIWSAKDPLPWIAYTLSGFAKLKNDKNKRAL